MKKIIILSVTFVALASFCFADEANKAKSMKIRTGDSFTITLRANSSAGYQWQFAAPLDKSMLQLLHSKYIPYRSKRLGADGKQLWIFKALKAGETSIVFEYIRPSEKDTPPRREETIKVIIK